MSSVKLTDLVFLKSHTNVIKHNKEREEGKVDLLDSVFP